MTPAPQSCTRSAPLLISRMKSLGGCKVVVRIEEGMTVVKLTSMTCQVTTATLHPGTSFG